MNRKLRTTPHGHTLPVLGKRNAAGGPTGVHVVAIDTAGAGHGEASIMLDEGNGARQVLA